MALIVPAEAIGNQSVCNCLFLIASATVFRLSYGNSDYVVQIKVNVFKQ